MSAVARTWAFFAFLSSSFLVLGIEPRPYALGECLPLSRPVSLLIYDRDGVCSDLGRVVWALCSSCAVAAALCGPLAGLCQSLAASLFLSTKFFASCRAGP